MTPASTWTEKFEVRPHRMQVVVQTQQENQKTGQQNRKQDFDENPKLRRGTHQPTSHAIPHAEQKREENCNPAQTRKRPVVQVALQTRTRDPATSHS